MLKIDNLHARTGDTDILNGLSISVGEGEVHAIMGPNGSGKSTLAQVVAGREDYEVTAGSVTLDGKNLLELEPEERAREGVFLGFQYPVEIPGVNNAYLLKAAVNARREHEGKDEIDAYEFLKLAREKMAMLEPRLAILDETDSGLDIDALKAVSEGVNALRAPDRAIILVTHYQRLLDYVEPDFVHVLSEGQIVRSGDKSLALELEEKGYEWVREAVNA
ncbi:MAG: ATP-binding cassette domain-containing protein [Pseudomonadota bacterium]